MEVSAGCMSRSHSTKVSSVRPVERDDDEVEDECDDNEEEDTDDECDNIEARPVPEASTRGKCRDAITTSMEEFSAAAVPGPADAPDGKVSATDALVAALACDAILLSPLFILSPCSARSCCCCCCCCS